MKDLISKVLPKREALPATAVVGVASFAAGFGVCYFIKRQQENMRLYEEYEMAFQEETEEEGNDEVGNVMTLGTPPAEDIFQHPTMKGRVTYHDVKDIPNIMADEEEAPEEEEDDEPVAQIVSIFTDQTDDWDMDAEIEGRDEESPYILHIEEFMNDERGYGQTTLTYYEGDDVLVDDKDVPIYNQSGTVGNLRFGHGSNDQNVVYIRNAKLHSEFEVILDHGFYEHEILGVDITTDLSRKDGVKHSQPRFRWEE